MQQIEFLLSLTSFLPAQPDKIFPKNLRKKSKKIKTETENKLRLFFHRPHSYQLDQTKALQRLRNTAAVSNNKV